MKLFSYPTAPSARRARIFLQEKGIDVAIENVDLRAGAHLMPEYLAVNPQGMVPTLCLEDGTTITENIAIAAYLEARVPDPPLFGSDPLSRARVLQWNVRVELEGILPLADYVRNSHPAFAHRALPGVIDYEQIPALADRGRARVTRFLSLLERQLKTSAFVAGSNYSFADITAVVFVDMLSMARLESTASGITEGPWYDKMRGRASYSA